MFAATAIGSHGSDWPHGRREASDRGSWTSPADANECVSRGRIGSPDAQRHKRLQGIPTGRVLSGDGIRFPSYRDRATRRP